MGQSHSQAIHTSWAGGTESRPTKFSISLSRANRRSREARWLEACKTGRLQDMQDLEARFKLALSSPSDCDIPRSSLTDVFEQALNSCTVDGQTVR